MLSFNFEFIFSKTHIKKKKLVCTETAPEINVDLKG